MIEFTLDDSGAEGTLVLSGSLTIQHAHPLKDALLKAVEEVDRLVINLEGVEAVDLTALQLLCGAHRDMIKRGKTLDLGGAIPEVIKRNIQESGFVECAGEEDTIGLWMGETS